MRFAVLIALMVGACATGSGPGPASLAGTSWTIAEVDGAAPVAGSSPSLDFDANGRASGDASCNRLTGGYAQDGAKLTFSQIATTRRACPPPIGEQEAKVLKILEGASGFEMSGPDLLISGSAGRLRLSR